MFVESSNHIINNKSSGNTFTTAFLLAIFPSPPSSVPPAPAACAPCRPACRSGQAPTAHSYLPAPKADPDSPSAHVLCLFTGLTKVEMCTDWDGLQLRFPSISKGRAHKIDIKKTDLQTQAKAFERANPSFTFCSTAPLRKTRKAPNSVRLQSHISLSFVKN